MSEELRAYIHNLQIRENELKDLHNKQVDNRENVTIAVRGKTLGKLYECRRIIKELSAL